MYSNGASEEWPGSRDRIVLATKFSFCAQPGNPNAGGNGRKNILRGIDASLRRLRTGFVDLYIVHAWDRVTPVEEVASTLDGLVRAGKVRHTGSATCRPGTLHASRRSASSAAASRPLAAELGLAITPWSPLGSGFLSGKSRRVGG